MLNRQLGKSKHNHSALLFVRQNVNRFAALISFFNQARKSAVAVRNLNSTLLEHPLRDSSTLAKDDELEWSYIHYAKDNYCWIRSGKAAGSDNSNPICGIVRRNAEGHAKKSTTATAGDGKCFYTLYLSRSNPNCLENTIGYFVDLK